MSFNDDKNLSSFFDKSGQNYNPPLEEMKELLSAYLTPEMIKDKTVLDAGCGIGLSCIIFNLWGAKEIVGLDISPESIQKANILKKEYKADDIEYIVADLDKFDLPNKKFDLIFSRGVSFYSLDLKKFLDGLTKAVKDDGFLVIDFVRNSQVTRMTERIRRIFKIIPKKYERILSKILSFIGFPIIKLILGKKAKLNNGKTTEQLFYEHFFSPVAMKTTTIDEIKQILGPDYTAVDLNVPNLGLHSPKTSFYLKITKNLNENITN
ncbi:MAG: class I SAM-dependent methyltransferase [Candidatus Buchananbacteria bacterium]|nr:class I SAM-dependent methyltransferase [Candidatus Buchananbacteria bacterium]